MNDRLAQLFPAEPIELEESECYTCTVPGYVAPSSVENAQLRLMGAETEYDEDLNRTVIFIPKPQPMCPSVNRVARAVRLFATGALVVMFLRIFLPVRISA